MPGNSQLGACTRLRLQMLCRHGQRGGCGAFLYGALAEQRCACSELISLCGFHILSEWLVTRTVSHAQALGLL